MSLSDRGRNSAYFFRLEKSGSKTNTIRRLQLDNVVCDNPKQVAIHTAQTSTASSTLVSIVIGVNVPFYNQLR